MSSNNHVVKTLALAAIIIAICACPRIVPTVAAQNVTQTDTGEMTIDGVRISKGSPNDSTRAYSPWAAATPLTTLSDRHAKRPAGVDADPIVRWMSDLAIRDDGASPTAAQLKSERTKFAKRSAFLVRDDEARLWVAGQRVGLMFDKSRYELQSFYDLKQGIEMLCTRPNDGSPFRVQVLRYRDDGTTGVLNFHPASGSGPDLRFLVEVGARNAALARHVLKVEGDELNLTLNWSNVRVPETPGQLDVSVTVIIPLKDGVTRWRGSVAGRLPRAGIAQFRCPVLPALGYPGEVDVAYAWGSQRGVLKRGDSSVTEGKYPTSQWALQHSSISFGPQTVLYFSAHDPQACSKYFRIAIGSELLHSAFVPNTGVMGNATYDQPYDVAIGPMDGNWYDAAKRYRKWATAHAPWAKPLKQRDTFSKAFLEVAYWIKTSWFHDDGTDGEEKWAFDQSMLRIAPKQQVDWYVDELGVDPRRLGVTHYNWQSEVYDTRWPHWTPIGPAVSAELHREKQMGLQSAMYTNPCFYDQLSPGFDQIQSAIVRNIDGSLYYEDYNCRGYLMNFSSDAFRGVAELWARQLRELGATGIYYDQLSGMDRGGDYDKSKNLPSLGLGGHAIASARTDAIREVRKMIGPGFGFYSEYFGEPDQDVYEIQTSWIEYEPTEIPLLPAVYSGQSVEMAVTLREKTQPNAAVITLAKGFLWGTIPGWTQNAIELKRNYTRTLLRQMVQLRVKLDEFVLYGELLRPPAFLDALPTMESGEFHVVSDARPSKTFDVCEASMWRADDGRRALLVANFDTSAHTVRFAAGDLQIVASDGKIKLVEPCGGAKVHLEADALVVDLPARSVAAVLLPAAGQ